MTEDATQEMPVVFYDGGCPLCRREVSHYRRIDSAGCIRWVDIHAQPEALGLYQLSWQQAMQRMHVLESNGRMVTGTRAFIAVWQRLPRYRVLARLVEIPGVFWLTERAYSLFARRRWNAYCDRMCEKS